MGAYQITHVRVSDNNATSTDKITDVKLSGGHPYSVAEIINFIKNGHEFFYTHGLYQTNKAFIEVVRPAYHDPYIRTKANNTTTDNLLSLTRF